MTPPSETHLSFLLPAGKAGTNDSSSLQRRSGPLRHPASIGCQPYQQHGAAPGAAKDNQEPQGGHHRAAAGREARRAPWLVDALLLQLGGGVLAGHLDSAVLTAISMECLWPRG
jgi:hypothetical protein